MGKDAKKTTEALEAELEAIETQIYDLSARADEIRKQIKAINMGFMFDDFAAKAIEGRFYMKARKVWNYHDCPVTVYEILSVKIPEKPKDWMWWGIEGRVREYRLRVADGDWYSTIEVTRIDDDCEHLDIAKMAQLTPERAKEFLDYVADPSMLDGDEPPKLTEWIALAPDPNVGEEKDG